MTDPCHMRIFLSSPGDVSDERALALQVIEQMPYDPLLRGKVTFEVIAWDKSGAGTPMLATMTPQEAINQGLPRPSECDIVVVIFWARMGTPLPEEYKKPDGSRYWSGTEWEYGDAFDAAKAAGRPLLVVYRRTEEPIIGLRDPKRVEKTEQWERVETFFEGFLNPDGSISGGYNPYEKPEDFRRAFETHLKALVKRLLETPPVKAPPADMPPAIALWPGSPFPGLRAFTPADAPIFFGRGRETDALVKRVSASRFVAVVGASGSGKSSLVGAGLIPRLNGNALAGSKDWLLPDYEPGRGWSGLRFTPGELGDNPFLALAARLAPLTGDTPRELAGRLGQDTPEWIATIGQTLADKPAWAEALLFIDQFEELFTVVGEAHRLPFAALLAAAASAERVRVVATMRADFYHRCVDVPPLVGLLESGSFPLGAPGQIALYEMIVRPGEQAGLVFEDGLPEQILGDTGDEPGALALLAYALDELYHARKDGRLTAAAYDALGRVSGAIGRRAESVFARLDAEAQAALPKVFRDLVEVDERGTATRRRAALAREAGDTATGRLVEAFTSARLLTTDKRGSEATVEVAHEAILRSWPRLAEWIEATQDDLRLLRQVRSAAAEWDKKGRPAYLLWPQERLKLVYAMQERLQPELNDVERDFIKPEQVRLLAELEDINTSHNRRREIGDRLDIIGDSRPGVGCALLPSPSAAFGRGRLEWGRMSSERSGGEGILLPDIAWCYVPGGEIEIEKRRFQVQPFYIAPYPITYVQFQAFLDAPDGFDNDVWWEGLTERYRKQAMAEQRNKFASYPRDNVSWYQAVAYTRWLDEKYVGAGLKPAPTEGAWQIRLPTEWEWQQAATGGNPANAYPWGAEWDGRRLNASEAGVGRATAVGMYPAGRSVVEALDMSGNVWEWCLNEYENPAAVAVGERTNRVLRGGSFFNAPGSCRCASRSGNVPSRVDGSGGLRVVCGASPSS